MKRSLLAVIVGFTVLLLLPAMVSADEPLSPEALSIANSLNCPVCQGESVRDSNSQLSHDIRQLIQQKLDQGQSRQQIVDFFVSRYGVTILRQPPKHGFSLALWWIPVAGIAFGAVVLVGFVTQRRRVALATAQNSATSSDDDADLALFEQRIRNDVAVFEEDLLGRPAASRSETASKPAHVDDVGGRGLAGSDQGVS